MAPIAHRLTGIVLNGGSGGRALATFLQGHAAAYVVDIDIAPSTSSAVRGDVAVLPFGDATFDSVLSNAVLEHVPDPDAVVAEMVRVLKPGGTAVLGIPFLQPFHASPSDYQRYTDVGIAHLGERHGLDIVDVLPDHSLAQTVGWIVWGALSERRQRVRQVVAWPLIFAWTRWSRTTDRRVVKHANSYIATFTKPSA